MTALPPEVRELIDDLTDPDPCWFDHHGYCQAHGWMQTEPACPHQRAKDALAQTAPALVSRPVDHHRVTDWERRAAATGGGPCPRCGKPFYTHVCLSCSPDAQTPGPGCVNCRHTGMDQTPCRSREAQP